MKWDKKKISELCYRVISGGTPSSGESSYYSGDIPWLRTQEVNFNRIYDTEIKITQQGLDSSSAKWIKSDSVIVAMYGNSAGRTAISRIELTTNQACCNLEIDSTKADSDYVYYYLTNKYSALKGLARGAAQSNLNSGDIKNFEISLPPLPTQCRIASILSAYDDLIENNLKRIRLLEEAAQNIYREWFVEMRFPGHETSNWYVDEKGRRLPEGWRYVRADEIFNINIGKTPPREEEQWFEGRNGEGIKWVSIKDLNNSDTYIFDTSERITVQGVERFNIRRVSAGTVLLSFKLTIGSVAITTEEMVTNEAIAHFNLNANGIVGKYFTYCYLKNFDYATLGSTSSIGTALNSKIVKALPIKLPEKKIMNQFESHVNHLFKMIECLVTNLNLLEEARDLLLPRLMNQTIEV